MSNITASKDAVKFATNILVTLGVSKIVKDHIRDVVVINSKFDQVKVWAGSFALGGMISEKVWLHTEEKIDEAYDFIEKIQGGNEEAKKAETAEEESQENGTIPVQ